MKIEKNLLTTIWISFFLAQAAPVYAQAPFWGLNPPAAGFDNLNELISVGISAALIAAGLIVLLYMFLGGFTYLTAGSDETRTKKARAIIMNAIIGLFLVAASWAIWGLIVGFIPGLPGLLGQ
jgi:hypothetical protein